MRLLHSTGGGRAFPSGLCRQLLTWGLPPSRLASGLLRSCHFFSQPDAILDTNFMRAKVKRSIYERHTDSIESTS
jgi:hypothetical protein